MNTHLWLSRLISGLISLVQASSLRDRYYTALSRIETLELAIEDLARITANTLDDHERTRLIKGICDRVKRPD
jgi:hypothetical protein